MRTVPLKHIARITVSNVDKKTASDERSVRLCNYTDVYYNERITANLPFMEATASRDQIYRFGLRAGDVLLTKDSETPDDIAVPAYVVAELPGVVCGYHLALLRPGQEVDGRYLFWALASRSSREQFSASANGITRFGLRYDSFGEVRVPLPPLARQRAIADYLDRETARIDALIEKKHSAAELLLERWLAALCSRLLGRNSHEPFSRVEQSAAGELTLIPLKRLLEHVWSGDWGGEPGSNDIDLTCIRAADFDFALLEASGGVDRSFAATSVRGRALLPGDLVIEKSGGGDGVPVGRVVVWRGPGLAMPTNFAGAMRPDPRFDPDFVLLVFRAAYEIGLPWRSIKQTTGLQNLDMTHYLSQHWPVPDVPEQRRVACELMEELRSCRKAQELFYRQIDLLREHRQALITAAVTGGLEVPEAAA